MGRFLLMFARGLRLAGIIFVVGAFLAVVSISLLGWAPSVSADLSRIALITVLLAVCLVILGFALIQIGRSISPSDRWLDFRPNRTKYRRLVEPGTESVPWEKTGILATVATDKSWGWQLGLEGKCLVEFESGHLFLEEPGKDLVMTEPRKVSRIGSVTLVLDTGRWRYGKITLSFDSASDADIVEREARKSVPQS